MRRNLPVQVLASCGVDGAIVPLRFRFEDGTHMLHTVKIEEVLDSRKIEYVGLEAFCYLCKAECEGREKVFELRYTVHTHRWVLFREVY